LVGLNALAALAAAPYRVTLWDAATGCVGSLALVGAGAQVWGFASTPTLRPYSITAYTVLAASGPAGCGGGAACPGAASGGTMYDATVASANDAALLSAASWSNFAMPAGGGLGRLQILALVASGIARKVGHITAITAGPFRLQPDRGIVLLGQPGIQKLGLFAEQFHAAFRRRHLPQTFGIGLPECARANHRNNPEYDPPHVLPHHLRANNT
jgi:hypothetical protein